MCDPYFEVILCFSNSGQVKEYRKYALICSVEFTLTYCPTLTPFPLKHCCIDGVNAFTSSVHTRQESLVSVVAMQGRAIDLCRVERASRDTLYCVYFFEEFSMLCIQSRADSGTC